MDYSDNDLVPSCPECGGPLQDDNHGETEFRLGPSSFSIVLCRNEPTLTTL